jgi:hypothetical protein
MVRF